MKKPTHPIRPDSKKKIRFGHLTAEVPLQEVWLFRNTEALRSVKRGLKQSQANQVKDAGSFSQYIEG